MASEALQRRIDDMKVEGWELSEEQGEDKAILIRRGWGDIKSHILIFLLTVWFTLGLGNVAYACYKHFGDVEKKVVRVNEDQLA